jgi:hypothetical protein
MTSGMTRRDALRGIGVGAGALVVGAAAKPAAASRMCPKTIGYWRNHTEQWVDDSGNPLEEMWVAGDPYPSLPEFADRNEVTVLDILNEPPRGDKSIIMVRQRIAAQLNYWASYKCPESHRAYAEATAWLWALDQPIVQNGKIGTNQRRWTVAVPETEIQTSVIDETVEAGTYGEEVKDRLEAFNTGKLCVCPEQPRPFSLK